MVALQVLTLGGARWSLAAVWRATLNAFGGSFFFTMVSGQDRANLGLLLAGGYAVLATGMCLVGSRRWSPTGTNDAPAVPGIHGANEDLAAAISR